MLITKMPLDLSEDMLLPFCKQTEDLVFFDIETTGLSWRSSHLYLLGMLFKSQDGWILEQWFLDHPFAEKAMLEDLARKLAGLAEGHPTLLVYNGKSFDIPYLKNKYAYYQLEDPLEGCRLSDLYPPLRPFKKALGLEDLKLPSVQKRAGFLRRDHSSGRELIQTYHDYLQTGDTALYQGMLAHNRDDMLGLPPLFSLCSMGRLLEGDFDISSCRLTSPALLQIDLDTPLPIGAIPEIRHMHFAVGPGGPEAASGLRLLLFGEEGERKYFFSDYKNYYYFPEEDRAIHKSLALYSDAGVRKKATAATCYERHRGIFFPQPAACLTPAFLEDAASSVSWFRPSDLPDPDSPDLRRLVTEILRTLFMS